MIELVCGGAVGAALVSFRRVAGPPALWMDRALISTWEFKAAIFAWVVFSVYWEIAGRNAAKAQKTESSASRGVHVFLANAALLLTIAPIHGIGRLLPPSAAVMIAGLAVEALGLCLTIWARRHLGRNWSGEISIKVDHELIRSGPYRLLRHPIYTGLLTMYVGTALVTGEWLAVVGVAAAVFAYWRKIRLEEANLNAAFAGEYEAWRRETWALLPGVY
jgi:protein-S-isoprenylcysteine O-methyltransferase Ste14